MPLAPAPEELGSRSLPTNKEAAAVALLHMEMAETSLADYDALTEKWTAEASRLEE